MANLPSSRTVSPAKPHFFQPLLPGFLHQILIPKAFLKNHLGGGDGGGEDACKDGVLRSTSGKCWPVKIKGRRFEAGWTEFAKEHDLHIGDFAVFRHEGGYIFHVEVYDPDASQREYPPFHPHPVHHQQEQEHALHRESSDVRVVHVDDDSDTVGTSVAKKAKLPKRRSMNKQASAPKVEASTDPCPHSYFVATVTRTSLEMCRFFIPRAFARANGISEKSCHVILRDHNGKSWPVKLIYWKSCDQLHMGRGWREVAMAYGLKKGDSVMFKFIKGGNKIILDFSVVSRRNCLAPKQKLKQALISTASSEPSEQEETLDQKPAVISKVGLSMAKKAKHPMSIPMNKQGMTPKAEASSPLHSHFVATVTQSSLKKYRLHIPTVFARANRICKTSCGMILRDQYGKSWHVKLNYCQSSGQFHIGRGWSKVVMAYGLKKGDSVMLKFIKGGKTVILDFSVGLSTSKQAKHSMPKPKQEITTKGRTLFPSRANSCFTTPVTHYCLRKSQLYIPAYFAKASGLCNRFRQMILQDQKGKRWPVSLRHLKGYGKVYITSGWRKVALAHGLKIGDLVMFELIKGGESPIVNFYGPYLQGNRRPKVKD